MTGMWHITGTPSIQSTFKKGDAGNSYKNASSIHKLVVVRNCFVVFKYIDYMETKLSRKRGNSFVLVENLLNPKLHFLAPIIEVPTADFVYYGYVNTN